MGVRRKKGLAYTMLIYSRNFDIQGGARKTPTDIHPHKMARNGLNVGIIGLDLEQINFFRKNPVSGLPDLFRPDNAMLSQNVRF